MSGGARSGWQGLALVAFAVLAADQATKYAVERFTAIGSTRVLVPGSACWPIRRRAGLLPC